MAIPTNSNYISHISQDKNIALPTETKARVISQGKAITRLKIGDDPRFSVAVKFITKESTWLDRLGATLGRALGFYAKVKDENGSTLLLNISSIAGRLHLKRGDIKKLEKKGNLLDSLDQQAQIVSDSEKIFGEGGLERIKKNTGLKIGVLLKVAQAALKTNLNADLTEKEIQVEGKTFFARLSKSGKLKLVHIHRRLGEGTFGTAFIAVDLNKGKEKVYKQARTEEDRRERAKEDIANEFNILTEIHKDGPVWGVQAKPKKFINITQNEGDDSIQERTGFLGVKYDSDYFKDIQKNPNLSFQDRLFEFHQLFSAMKSLHAKGIVHGDLKPQNILVKTDSNGVKFVHISDLGGARNVKDLSVHEIINSPYTPAYTPREDMEKAKELAEKGDREGVIELVKKTDVFSIGLVVYEAFSGGKDAFPLDKDNHPILSEYRELNEFNIDIGLNNPIPQEMEDIVKKMLHPDYKQRPTFDEAMQALETLIQKYPKLNNKIQDLMKNYTQLK